MVNVTSRWCPADYARSAAFVPALGQAALDRLAPRPGELILDIGCGDGALTERIADAGAKVIGLDSSEDMVEAARARGIDAFVADAEALDLEKQVERFGRFDAVFSNAALHWMIEADSVARGVFAMLKEGGRFVGEMGGAGNLAIIRAGLREALVERGYEVPAEDMAWYPTVEEFARVYGAAGFTDIQAERIDRPTDLPAGIGGWVKTFRSGLLDLAMVPGWARDEVAEAVERRVGPELRGPDGGYFADYVRLRFSMRKPE